MQIEKEIAEWHRETFPNATQEAILDKLMEETAELVDAVRQADKRYHLGNVFDIFYEFADVFIVFVALLDRVSIGKISVEDIVMAKLAVNKKRQWGEETANGDRPRVK
jgi:NTP pyrophosphatase (non-canonical NTP hydrolase)